MALGDELQGGSSTSPIFQQNLLAAMLQQQNSMDPMIQASQMQQQNSQTSQLQELNRQYSGAQQPGSNSMFNSIFNPSLGSLSQPQNSLLLCGDDKKPSSQNMTECVPVPSSEHVAEIVGRQGCKIKALRAKTNTYIKTPVRGEEPIFVVTGRKEDVANAKKEILSAADHFSQIRACRRGNLNGSMAPGPPANMPGHVTDTVEVPYKVVGLVVGPKGATIKRIQQSTNTYIVTPSREKEPRFEVSGLPANVESARKLIQSHIAERTGNNSIDLPMETLQRNMNLMSLNNAMLNGALPSSVDSLGQNFLPTNQTQSLNSMLSTNLSNGGRSVMNSNSNSYLNNFGNNSPTNSALNSYNYQQEMSLLPQLNNFGNGGSSSSIGNVADNILAQPFSSSNTNSLLGETANNLYQGSTNGMGLGSSSDLAFSLNGLLSSDNGRNGFSLEQQNNQRNGLSSQNLQSFSLNGLNLRNQLNSGTTQNFFSTPNSDEGIGTSGSSNNTSEHSSPGLERNLPNPPPPTPWCNDSSSLNFNAFTRPFPVTSSLRQNSTTSNTDSRTNSLLNGFGSDNDVFGAYTPTTSTATNIFAVGGPVMNETSPSSSPPTDPLTSFSGSDSNSPSSRLSPVSRTCVMCRTGEVVAALSPCGHNITCMACALRLKNDKAECPSCKVVVSDSIMLRSA